MKHKLFAQTKKLFTRRSAGVKNNITKTTRFRTKISPKNQNDNKVSKQQEINKVIIKTKINNPTNSSTKASTSKVRPMNVTIKNTSGSKITFPKFEENKGYTREIYDRTYNLYKNHTFSNQLQGSGLDISAVMRDATTYKTKPLSFLEQQFRKFVPSNLSKSVSIAIAKNNPNMMSKALNAMIDNLGAVKRDARNEFNKNMAAWLPIGIAIAVALGGSSGEVINSK